MDPRPGAFVLQSQFQNRRTVIGQQRLPDVVALAALGKAFGIAGVIGQHFLRPITAGSWSRNTFAP